MRITALEIEHYEVKGIPSRWRDGLMGGAGDGGRESLLRVKTDANIDGLVGLQHRAISEVIRACLAPMFIGDDPLMREKIWLELWERAGSRSFPCTFEVYRRRF